jgi:hypothetical protein
MPKTIEQIWTENNFPTSWKVLQDKVNKAGLNMPPKDVVTFLKSKSKWTLLNAAGRPKHFNSVVAKEPGSNYMVDIIVYDRWEIKNYKYILSCIDIHSRYAEGVALTHKTGAVVTSAMLKIFKKMGRVPHTLQMDNGGEFTGKAFKTAMKNAGVKVLFYSDVSDLRKQSVIERHNRTLAGLLRKWRENSGKKDWHNQLDRMYTIYNSNLHSTIKATPKDVWGLKDANKQDITKVSTNLEVGMTVRMQIKPDAFKKGDTKQYSDEILTSW